jgi:hypothetical protein
MSEGIVNIECRFDELSKLLLICRYIAEQSPEVGVLSENYLVYAVGRGLIPCLPGIINKSARKDVVLREMGSGWCLQPSWERLGS